MISYKEPDLFSLPVGPDENLDLLAKARQSSRIQCGYTTGLKPSNEAEAAAIDKRLFVPLAKQPFAWFCSGQKQWELRRFGRQYTDRHIFTGRIVELRRGYNSRDALWGRVGQIVQTNDISEFFDIVPFKSVIPIADSTADAIQIAKRILGANDGVPIIGFEVQFGR